MEFVKNPVYVTEYVIHGFRMLEAKNDWIAFRSQPSSYVVPGELKPRPTVDLILLGAIFIELPTLFYDDVKVTRPRDQLSKSYAEKYDLGFNLHSDNDERVYALESDGSRFHVVTANLWVYVYKERIGELPLNHFYNSDLKSYNDYLDKYVEEWIKIE